jgi:hypothetical protein
VLGLGGGGLTEILKPHEARVVEGLDFEQVGGGLHPQAHVAQGVRNLLRSGFGGNRLLLHFEMADEIDILVIRHAPAVSNVGEGDGGESLALLPAAAKAILENLTTSVTFGCGDVPRKELKTVTSFLDPSILASQAISCLRRCYGRGRQPASFEKQSGLSIYLFYFIRH